MQCNHGEEKSGVNPSGRRPRRNRFRPGLAILESRRLLATFDWIASSGGTWNDPANWKNQDGKPGVPGAADTAVIDNGKVDVSVTTPVAVASLQCAGTLTVASGTFNVANTAASRIARLELSPGAVFQSSGGSITLSSGTIAGTLWAQAGVIQFADGTTSFDAGAQLDGPGQFDVPANGTATFRAAATVNAPMSLNGGTISGTGTVSIAGSLTWSSGIMTGAGTTFISPGGSLELVGTESKDLSTSRVLTNEGTINWSGGGTWILGEDAVVNNIGTLNETGGARLEGGSYYKHAYLKNSGALNVNPGAGATLRFTTWDDFENTGNLAVQSGKLELRDYCQDSGATDVAAGASLDIVAQSEFRLVGGTSPTFSGTGVVRVGDFSTILAYAPMRLANLVIQGALGGSGAVTVTSSLAVSRGNLYAAGSLTVAQGATMSMADARIERGYTFVNAGTGTMSGQMGLSDGATVENLGTLRISSLRIVGSREEPTYLKNAGTLSVDELKLEFGSELSNSGTINIVNQGNVLLTNGGTNTGTINAADNAQFDLFGGTLTASGPAPAFLGPGLFDVGATLTASSAVTFSNLKIFPDGTINGSGPLTVADDVTLFGGKLSGPGSLSVARNATLTIKSPYETTIADGYTVTNNGQATFSSPGKLRTVGGGVLNNAGMMSARDVGATGAFKGVLVNSGTVDVTNGQYDYPFEFASAGGLVNTGTVNVLSGRLELDAGMTNSGTVNASDGARVLFKGGTSLFNGEGARLTGPGAFELIDGQLTASSPIAVANLKMTGGTIDGPATMTIAGNFNFSGGELSGPGRLVVASTGTATIPDDANKTVTNGYTLELAGATNWFGRGPLVVDQGAVVQNRGVFNVKSAATLAGNGGTLDNRGTLTISTGDRFNRLTISGNDALNNAGTVDLVAGSVFLHGGGMEAGQFNLGGDTHFELDKGTMRFETGSAVTGAGPLEVAGGTLVTDTPLTVENLRFSSGTIDNEQTMTVPSTFNWGDGRFVGQGATMIGRGAAETFWPGSKQVEGNHLLVLGGFGAWLSGTLSIGEDAVVNNDGNMDILGEVRITNASLSGKGSFNNYGNFTVRPSRDSVTQVSGGVAFNNFGHVTVFDGGLTLAGGGSQSGEINAWERAAAGLEFAGGTIRLNGNDTDLGGEGGPGRYVFSGGVLTGPDGRGTLNLVDDATLQWSGGQIDAPAGATLVLHGGAVTLLGPGDKTITGGGTLQSSSKMDLEGAGNLVLASAPRGAALTFDVARDGTLVFGHGGGIAAGAGGGGSVLIQGRLVKKGTSTTTVAAPLTNSGTIDVEAGKMAIRSDFTQGPGAALAVAIGGSDLQPTIAGLRVDGNIALGGRLTVTDPNHISVPIGNTLTLIDNPWFYRVTGTFDGLPEGAELSVSGMTFAISYRGGWLGTDVVLKRVR
jgi:hypothetical protein